MDVRSPLFQNVATVLIGILFLNPIISTAAQVTVNAAAGGNTSLDQAGNGVPIVNIATPNGSGLSHNSFSDYNVGQQGLILNNATAQTQATQLGGLILGNPNFKGQAANLILNEVNGANPSQLKGYTEVAGQGAHVVVANPHGITCDGCGFINTPRVTLSTGKPLLENGRLERFDVDAGQISIQGQGLNASNVDQFDLITRSAKINAEIYANQLNVIAGRNQVKADDLAVTAKAADDSEKPLLAIDSSALGGMYAGAIRLIGTEQGVGVKLAGDMAASAGDIHIDAKGQLSLAQATASQNLQLKAASLALNGKAYAGASVAVQTQGALSLAKGQSLAARQRIELQGGQLDNQGLIEAGVNADNSRNLIGDVALSGQSLRNSGSVLASRALSVDTSQALDNQGGTLRGKSQTTIEAATLSNGNGRVLSEGSLNIGVDELENAGGLLASDKALSVTAGAGLNNQGGEISSQTKVSVGADSLDNRGGLIAAGSQLEVTASSLNNSGKGTLSSQGDLTATVTKTLDNHGEGVLFSQGALSVQAQALDNSQAGVLSSQGSLRVTQAALNNQGGIIVADQRLSLASESLDNRNGGLVSGKADVSVELNQALDNRGQGTLVADGTLKVGAAELLNGDRGQVAAKGDLKVTVGSLEQQGDASTQAGELLSQGKLTLVAERIDNRQGGLIAATQGLDIQASNSLHNAAGEISTQGQASVRLQATAGQPAALLDNSGAGSIIGAQGLELTVQRLLNNAKGLLAGRDSLVLIGDSLDNSGGGTLSSQQTLSVELTGALANQGEGALISGGSLTVGAASLDNSADGLLSSAGLLDLNRGSLNNRGGKLISDGQLSIGNSSVDNRASGVISAKQALSIVTGQLDNQQKGLITGDAGLTLVTGQLNNHDQGRIAGKGSVHVSASGLDQHSGGELVSETALTLDLNSGVLNNRDQGLIATPGALLLHNLGRVDNGAGGEISSAQGFVLKASELDNSAGRIISGQALQLQITQALLNNLKGVLSAVGPLSVTAASLDNSGAGVLASQGDLEVTLTGMLDNHDQGLISAGQVLTVDSASLDNSAQGLLASGGALTLASGAVDNQGGTLASQANLNATSADLDNRGGVLSSQQQLSLIAAAVDNRDAGLITSAAGLSLSADSLDSSRDLAALGGEVSAKQALSLTVAKLIQQQGRLIGEAGVSLNLLNGDLDNRGGLISATGPLTVLNLGKLDNRDAGEVSSNQSYSLNADAIDNGDQGRLISAGSLSLDLGSGTLRNAGGGLVSGWQGLTVNAGNLDNRAKGTLSSRDGALKIELSGATRALNNSDEGALVSQGALEVIAGSLDNSAKGIVSSASDLNLTLTGTLDNHAGGLIDSQGRLTATAGAVDNQAGQISSQQAALLTAASLDNRGGQLSSAAALTLSLIDKLSNANQGQVASAGPLLLQAAAIDNQGGSLISQDLLRITGSSLNNAGGGTLAARNALDMVLTGGALNNSGDGLILSEQGSLAIQAQSLNNHGGVLSSQQDLTLSLDGKLDNQGGRIESQAGNLDLQKTSAVDNSGGVLNSLTGWLKLVSSGLFDNDAGTTQAQALEITATGVDNRAGHLSALAGDTRITATGATFNNQGGGLYAHQLLKVIASDFNNQGAAQDLGGKVAAAAIDFSLSGTLNNQYGLVESASDLQLSAASIDNQHGSLRALGQTGTTHLGSSSLLNNQDGVIETANADLQLDVSSLHNSDGRIQHLGSGGFGLSAANVTQAGGSLISNGLLNISAASWVNSSVLQAGQLVLSIGSFTQTASGQLLASQSFIGTGTSWVNDGLLASDGDFSLNLSGAYSGTGQLSSLGALSLSAASIDLASSARIVGGGLTTVSADGLLSNRGKLTSAGDLTARAGTLNNYATLGSAEKLSLYAPTLLNENGLIFSGADMALRSSSLTNLKADIYSLGELSIAKDDAGNQLDLLENRSGSIESLGDMSLRAAVFSNRKELFSTGQTLTYGFIHVVCYDCGGDHHNVDYVATERFDTTVEEDSAAAQIYSGGDLAIQGGSIVNRYSSLAAAGDIVISATTLANTGAALGNAERVRRFNTGRVTDGTDERFRANYINPYNALPLPKEVPGALYSFTLVSDIETQTNTGIGAAAIIQAGGNVSIQAAQTLENSVVREDHLQSGGANRVADTAAQGTGTTLVVQLNPQLPPDLQQQQVNPLTLPGFSLPQGDNGLFRLSGQSAVDSAASSVQGAAGGNIQVARGVSVGDSERTQGYAGSQGSAFSITTQNGSTPGATHTAVAGQAVQTVAGLPGVNASSKPHRYLIETNPELTSLKQFLGSDYLLGKLGYTPDNTQKRLGDGLYEQRLIRAAIVARTGQRFLAGMNSDEAMFRYLMDNAIASKQALNLSVGVSLSAEQVAALTHDIVWMEEYEVAGEQVLVPVLYLAQAEGRLAPSGALIQGRDVALISGGELINTGTLRASNNLNITANNISNSGLMQANERLSLLATDSIRNAQGGIISGRDVRAIALTGDILNERSITQERRSGRDFSQLSSVVDSAARIEASNGLSLSAGRDIQNIGGVLSAGGLGQLTAGRDVVIASATEEQGRMRKDKRHFWSNSSGTQHASSVQVGGDLSVEAGQDLAVIASRVKAGGDIALAAGRDVVIAAAANESSSEYRYSRSKKKIHQENAQVRQQAAEIEAGGNLAIVSGKGLTVSASRLEAGDEAYLYAGNDLNLLAESNRDYSFYSKMKKKSGSFGSSSKKSTLDESEVISAVGSSIVAGSAVLVAGHDLNVKGSAVESSTGDVSLLAANDIRIGHVLDSTATMHASSSSKSSWGGLKSGKAKREVTESQTQAVGSLISGDNVNVQAGRDVQITASGVVSTQDLNILAGRDLTVDAAANTFTRDEKYKAKSRDLSGIATANNLGLDDITGNQHLSISKQKGNSKAAEVTLTGSTLGSSEGSVTLTAGRKIGVIASDLVSTQDMTLTASDVTIAAGIETAKQSSKSGSNSLAVGRVVGGTVVDTVQSIYDSAKAASEADDDRLKAVKGAQALLSAYSAVQQGSSAAANIADGKPANSSGSLIKIGTELAHTRSKSSSEYSSEQVKQSNLSSGGSLSIVASGAEASTQGDIHVIGSGLKAAETQLLAKRDVILESAQNRSEWDNNDKTNRTSIGASFNIGQQNGFTLDLGAKAAIGTGKGHELTQVNSTLDTGTLLLVSGQDTTLAGAQIRADNVQAAIGGDLNIVSRQDEAKSNNEQKSAGFGGSICVPPFCYGATVTASGSLAAGNTSTLYQAVTEQSGIYAGQGGYDISVADTTRLHGAVIASEAAADKNRLSTERLEHSDIRNRSEIESQSASLSVSYSSGGTTKGGEDGDIKALSSLGGGLPLALEDSDRSTTRSAISPGSIEVRSAAGAQDLDGLSRNTTGANQLLDRPDEKAMQERMDLIQSTVALGQSVVSTISQAKQKAAQEKFTQADKTGSLEDVAAANAAIEDAKKWDVGGDKRLFADIATGLLAAGLGGTGGGTSEGIVANTTAADTFNQIGDYADKKHSEATDETSKAAWDEGGIARVLLHATAGAIQGLAGGSVASSALGAGASAALMPAIGDALKDSGLNEADSKAVATLIATGMGVAAGSGGGLTGQVAAGNSAAGVELYNRQLHPDERMLIEKQAKVLAKEKGISEEEATRRLAAVFAYYTDADWQQTIAGREIFDSSTLVHLGIALAPLGNRYDVAAAEGDVPMLIDLSRPYTAAETLRLLQNYQLNHTDFYDPLVNADSLVSYTPEGWAQNDFYRKYLNYYSGSGVLPGLWGAAQGTGAAVDKTASNLYGVGKSLVGDFTGTSSLLVNGTLQSISKPDELLKAFNQAKTEADAQAFLYQLQGNPEAAAKVDAQWATEFALNFVALNRVGGVGKAAAGDGAKATGPVNNASTTSTANSGTHAGAADAEAGLNTPLISSSSPFNTKGVNPDLPSVQSVRADLYSEYKAADLSDDLAKNLADGNIKSGSTVPIKRDIDQGEALYKFVSANNVPGRSSYYFTKSEVEYFKNNPEKLAQEAGLPYKNFVGSYDVYAIKPRPGTRPVVFESKVAEIQEGGYTAKGGASQTIVPNLKNWSVPEKVDVLRVYGNE